MLHCDKKDHRIDRKDFYEIVATKTDSISVKMIDFSNIVELKQRIVNRSGMQLFGKFAEIKNPVAHQDYFPHEMLKQVYFGKNPCF